ERLDAPAVERRQRALAADEMERCPLLRARLGQDKDSASEIERGERGPARNLRPRRPPAEPAGDHQVQDEKEILLELEDDPLAHPPQAEHLLSLGLANRR